MSIRGNNLWSLRKALVVSLLLQLLLFTIPVISGAVGGYIVGRKSPHHPAFWVSFPTFAAALLSPLFWKLIVVPSDSSSDDLVIFGLIGVFFVLLSINLTFAFLGALAGKDGYKKQLAH